jgi:hypothetical protein
VFFVGCTQKGVVVEKRRKPSPFAYSAGIDGIYSFLLRDEQGRVHSQMVPADVFNRYEIGDLFDAQQAGPAERSGFSKESDVYDSKSVKPAKHAVVHKKPHRAVASTHKKHRALRAAVKPREDEKAANEKTAQPPVGANAAVMLRPPTPETQGLDVHP